MRSSYHQPSSRPLAVGIISAILGVVLLLSACASGSDSTSATGNDRSVAGVSIPPTPNVTPPPSGTTLAGGNGAGMPAPGLPGITPSNPGTVPAFSMDDLKHYVSGHPIPGNMGGGQGTITQSEFLLSKQVTHLLGGEPTEMPDNAPLAYVELSGDFVFPGVANNPLLRFKNAFEVFDATTGALIMEGGLSQPTNPTGAGPTPTSPPSQATPTPTATTAPQPTATPAPVVQFNVSPLSGKQQCTGNYSLSPFTVNLDNTGSTIPVNYSVTITDVAPNTADYWATASAASGTVGAGSAATLTITPNNELCRRSNLPASGETFHVIVKQTSGGSATFTVAYTVSPPPVIG